MKGYTLIEIMLVIAIVLTVGFLSGVFPLRLIFRTEVQSSADKIRSVLYEAQANAISGRRHSAWGAHYGNHRVTLFKGNSYAGRDQSFDKNTEINEKVSVSGFTDAIFVAPGGRPEAAISGITLERGGATAEFSLNEEGVVE